MATTSTSWSDLRSDARLQRLATLQRDTNERAVRVGLRPDDFAILRDPGWADRALRRTASTFTLFVMGQVSTGKSSLINALLGRRLLPVSSDPTDGVISVLLPASDGRERAERVLADGTVVPFANVKEAVGFLRQQNTPSSVQLATQEVRLYLLDPMLRVFRIVNTPGLGDRLAAFEEKALGYLAEDESDAVIWTFFPDVAGNQQEVEVFGRALERRRNAVVGVITRCLEGKSAEYDPQADPELNSVEAALRRHLGMYLTEVVRFDSHEARKVHERLRADASDPTLACDAERCGKVAMDRTLQRLLPRGTEGIDDARSRAFLLRAEATAQALAAVNDAIVHVAAQRTAATQAEQLAWRKFQREKLDPVRNQLREDICQLTERRAKELTELLGHGAHDVLIKNFGLVETLLRSVGSWTPWCDPMGDKLMQVLGEQLTITVQQSGFEARVAADVDSCVRGRLTELARELEVILEKTNAGSPAVDPLRVSPDSVVVDAFGASAKALLAAVLKHVKTAVQKKAAEQSVKKAGSTAAQQVVSKAATQVAEQATTQSLLGAFAGVLSMASLVLIPLEIHKLWSEFNKGREHAAKTLQHRYVASRTTYEARLFDALWPSVEDQYNRVMNAALIRSEGRDRDHQNWEQLTRQAEDGARSLRDIATEFAR